VTISSTAIRRLLGVACALGISAAAAASQANQPTQPAPTVVRAARMIDVKAGTVVDNPVIVIRGSRIVSVGLGGLALASGVGVLFF